VRNFTTGAPVAGLGPERRVGARITVTVQRATDAHTVPVVIGAAQP
jgi:hypothetical protein